MTGRNTNRNRPPTPLLQDDWAGGGCERTNKVAPLFLVRGEIVRSLESSEVKALVPPSPGRAVLGLPGRTGCGSARRPARS